MACLTRIHFASSCLKKRTPDPSGQSQRRRGYFISHLRRKFATPTAISWSLSSFALSTKKALRASTQNITTLILGRSVSAGSNIRSSSHNTWELDERGQRDQALQWVFRFRPRGSHLLSVDLHLSGPIETVELEKKFDLSSLAMSYVEDDAALVATDFRPDNDGFVRLHIANFNLSQIGAGALAQRLLELATYRILCLLGLFEAQRIAPALYRIEQSLSALVSAIQKDSSHSRNEAVLNELVDLSAALEADELRTQYRFAASKAYYEIVQGRVEAIHETRCGASATFAGFMSRRLAPAMRTCTTMERRQGALASKLMRMAELLRTRVNCEIECQSHDLLVSMNDRAHSQFQLQRTVERLSIAAISYYVVALLAYAFKGLGESGWGGNPDLETTLSIPLVLIAVCTLFAVLHRRNDTS